MSGEGPVSPSRGAVPLILYMHEGAGWHHLGFCRFIPCSRLWSHPWTIPEEESCGSRGCDGLCAGLPARAWSWHHGFSSCCATNSPGFHVHACLERPTQLYVLVTCCASRDCIRTFGVLLGFAYAAYASSGAEGCGFLSQHICTQLRHSTVQEAVVELACSQFSVCWVFWQARL
jgi:hypothetical protein